MNDDKVYEMLCTRFDRLETKVDSLLEFKFSWVGRMSIISVLFSILTTVLIKVVF